MKQTAKAAILGTQKLFPNPYQHKTMYGIYGYKAVQNLSCLKARFLSKVSKSCDSKELILQGAISLSGTVI